MLVVEVQTKRTFQFQVLELLDRVQHRCHHYSLLGILFLNIDLLVSCLQLEQGYVAYIEQEFLRLQVRVTMQSSAIIGMAPFNMFIPFEKKIAESTKGQTSNTAFNCSCLQTVCPVFSCSSCLVQYSQSNRKTAVHFKRTEQHSIQYTIEGLQGARLRAQSREINAILKYMQKFQNEVFSASLAGVASCTNLASL